MNTIVKPYLFRASLLAGLAILLGLTMSFVVYISSEKVRDNAVDLVNNRIPILASVNHISADLSEQERIIYEYYRSQNPEGFLAQFAQNNSSFSMHSVAIAKQPALIIESELIQRRQLEIEKLSEKFHQGMLSQENNWDYLRELLAKITLVRIELEPTLLRIEQKTKEAVNEGHKATLLQMEITHWTVIFYGVTIVLLSIVISKYLKQFILTNAENTRLAMFPHRNPNPIISVNDSGEISFFNPASVILLESVGLSELDIKQLIPSNFANLRHDIKHQQNTSLTVEQSLKNRLLQVNINWIKEVNAYDLHIVDITERRLAEQKVKNIAFYVQETNLPNQYKLNNDLDELISKQISFSLGAFELKSFSKMVTAWGGDTTNEIVRVFSSTVIKHLPNSVTLYQLNESQFSLVCLESISEESLRALTKIVEDLTHKPVITNCGEFFIELDFGYCVYPEHGDNRNTLFKNLHTALVMVRADKQNQFAIFKAEYAKDIHNNAEIIDNLRNAVVNNELFLVFQPQLNLNENRVFGIETLVRWRHKNKIISPADFIPLAEQSGLIVPIGQWILKQACIFAKQLVELGHHDIVVAVNVSPRQFSHLHFCQNVVEALSESRLSPHHLELEITEGMFMHNEVNTLAVLHQLKSLGIQMSIDDFGTGYSSLSYLKRFPVNKLKIDQSFILDCHKNNEDRAIVNTIVALGKNLGLSLIAEGVEELEHVDFLKSIGCNEIQGYWYSKPLESNDLIDFLLPQLK